MIRQQSCFQEPDPLSLPIYGDVGDRTDPAILDELRGLGPHEASTAVSLRLIGSFESSQKRSGSTTNRLIGKTAAGTAGNAYWKIRSVT